MILVQRMENVNSHQSGGEGFHCPQAKSMLTLSNGLSGKTDIILERLSGLHWNQPRPQGAFPWLWPRRQSQGKAPWGRGCTGVTIWHGK